MRRQRIAAAASTNSWTRAWAKLMAIASQVAEVTTRTLREPGAEMASWPLSPKPSSAGRARRLTRAQLADWRAAHHSEVAELLVTELVTHALHHATGPIRLSLWCIDGTVRCEVEDAAAPVPPPVRDYAEEPERGLGSLIDELACCWGSVPTPAGKAVWFELPHRLLP
ncbi:ATP-binding protein [Nonomuraea lactucae]|uniref:ATP-binding protein n=1 Tax=Nonomuraea lactucae TaxID=2249762 RepID=UPI0013B4356A|nr:ATP-binding protein [Nonomuraea lactucae]